MQCFLRICFGLAITVAAVGDAAAELPPAPEWLVAPTDPTPSLRAPSYFEHHYARVERDLLMFQHGYTLEHMRERDQLELCGATPGSSTSTVAGVGVFSAVVVGAAHTPAPLRFAFDRSLHLGPAIFEGGGMGAGFGGSL
ncbi:MAG: hypothetical protein ACXVAN_07225 [Polyangia bacterium]